MPTIPHITPERIAASKERLAAFNRQHPPGRPVTIEDVAGALAYAGQDDYFITTALYWDCKCVTDFHRPREMALCERCGARAEDCADARIHEMKAAGIHLDFHDPAVRATLDEHNLGAKYPLAV